MTDIRILTDSACDIPPDEAGRRGLSVISFPLTVGDKTYFQGKDFIRPEEFFPILERSQEIPKTSQITVFRYVEEFFKIFLSGASEIIVITINSLASSTYQNALIASESFFTEHPEAQGRLKIHVVDSKTYSVAYGYPCLTACDMAIGGSSSADILNYLNAWFSRVEVYVAAYSLEYARKSGRLGAASAVVGTALGIRPIISLVGGVSKTYCTVRGAAAVAEKLLEITTTRISDDHVYGMLRGTMPEVDKTLKKRATSALKKEPFGVYTVGPAVAVNIGPKMLGIGFLGKAR